MNLIRQTFLAAQQAYELEKMGFNEPTLLSVKRISFENYGESKLVSNIASSTNGAYISIDPDGNHIPLPTFEQAFMFLDNNIKNKSGYIKSLIDCPINLPAESKTARLDTLIWALELQRKEANNAE